jgi:hypothetical protein
VLVQTLIYIFGTPLLSFSLALLAAAGVHALALGRVSLRAAIGAGIAFVLYLAIAALLNWPALQVGDGSHAVATVGLAGAAGLGAWVCVAVGRTLPRALAATVACGVVVAELFVLAPHDVYSDRYDSLAEPPYVSWLRQQHAARQPFRVFSNDGLLYPNYAQAFGLDDPRVIDGQWPHRTWDFVQTFLSPTITDRYVGGFGHPELPTELLANKWLDFSNVLFVLRPANQNPSDATLAQVIAAANYPSNDDHHVSQFTIAGQRREVLVERTPGEVVFRMRPDAAQPRLTFFVGLDPNAALSSAQFTLSINSTGQRHVLFQQALDARIWIPGSIDLTPFLGQNIELILQTKSLDDTVASPGWGDLRLWPPPDAGQFKQVYSGEVSIWENTHAAARAFLVGNIERAASPDDAIARMQAPGFDPRVTAVVEGEAVLPAWPTLAESAGSVRITAYDQQQVKIAVDARNPALVVLTDSYYPGWTATLDGAETPVLATDLAFRGVLVPPGVHQVTLTYAPASFSIGLALAAAAVALLGLLLWRLPSEPTLSPPPPGRGRG